MNILLLAVPVILSTIVWPLNRSAMQNGGRNDMYGFWITLSGAITATLVALISGQSFASINLWLIGSFIGVAFTIGFCLIITYSMKIGPTGPTAAANNMGLVGPVAVSLFYPTIKSLSIGAVFGFIGVIISLIGFAVGASNSGEKKAITRKWVLLVIIGWFFAALSMTGQYVGSVVVPDKPITLVAVFCIIGTIILFPFVIRRGKTWFNKQEMIFGCANGATQAVSNSLMLIVLQRLSAEIVYPVTVLGPVIAVLFLSAIVYKEKLNRISWLACFIGLVGLALLTLNR